MKAKEKKTLGNLYKHMVHQQICPSKSQIPCVCVLMHMYYVYVLIQLYIKCIYFIQLVFSPYLTLSCCLALMNKTLAYIHTHKQYSHLFLYAHTQILCRHRLWRRHIRLEQCMQAHATAAYITDTLVRTHTVPELYSSAAW